MYRTTTVYTAGKKVVSTSAKEHNPAPGRSPSARRRARARDQSRG
eukprot:COSAG02_NODE_4772_length_4994_cov_16.312768_1_plen_44_part_10